MWEILILSFLSGMATPFGGWLVLRFRSLSEKILAVFLGMAAGIMTTVVLTELMPVSINSGGHEVFIIGAGSGWLFMWGLRALLVRAMGPAGLWGKQGDFLQMGAFLSFAIALHDFPEGLAIGAGDAIQPEIGLIITLAIALHNIPEGISVAVPLRLAGVAPGKILWITFLTGIVTPMGTMISLWLFSVSTVFISLSLAFAGGAMVYVVSRDLLPEGFQANILYTCLGTAVGSLVMIGVSGLH